MNGANLFAFKEFIFRSGYFGQMEVPQVFKVGEKWYCLFCTADIHWLEAYKKQNPQSPVKGSHYLIADSYKGPWEVAPGNFLDGDQPPWRYAGKIVFKNGTPQIMGFLHDTPTGEFIGKISNPVLLGIDKNGLFVPIANPRAC